MKKTLLSKLDDHPKVLVTTPGLRIIGYRSIKKNKIICIDTGKGKLYEYCPMHTFSVVNILKKDPELTWEEQKILLDKKKDIELIQSQYTIEKIDVI